MLKILHTSDLHLGAKLGWLGDKASEQREQLNKTFERIIDFAINEQVNVFIIAGDLFDNPHPSGVLRSFVDRQISRLLAKKIYVIILPGNHDCLEKGSVYLENFSEESFLHVFRTGDIESFNISDLDLTVYGSGIKDKYTQEVDFNKLVDQKNNTNNLKYSLAIVHGGVKIKDNMTSKELIEPEEVEKSGFNYVALGDWHGVLNISNGSTKAWYSGSPELLAKDQTNSGNILIIKIGDDGIFKVEKKGIGTRSVIQKEINIDQMSFNEKNTPEKLQRKLIDKIQTDISNEDIVLVNILGTKSVSQIIEVNEIIEILQNDIFKIFINDKTELEISEEELANYPEELVIGRYIKLVKKQIEDESDPIKKEVLKEVLQEGVKRLIDKN